jgi:hydroxymethylpyrimidine pyrophosphatase-like HAD family hydrolase/energy-coupling factor transporter ATP-binding protein EcfA2
VFFVALAIDYDGTLARNGRVDAATTDALREVKKSGRKLILVTGRDLSDLSNVFSEFELFDLVVAENGGLLFNPASSEEIPLAEAPPAALIGRLGELGVSPLSVGRCIVATWEPNETAVLKAIHDLGLELHIIFNKGAVMVLPSYVNKASGLSQALDRLGLSPYNVVGIGDAENDQTLLSSCGCAVAVANALPSVKEKVDFIVADHGAGVIELARRLTETDLSSADVQVAKIQPVLGEAADEAPVRLSPTDTVLVTGSSGGGKSTIVTALLEQMCEVRLQFCVVDPEGDYAELEGAVVVGDSRQEPRISEVLELLARPAVNVVLNLLAIDPAERPRFMAKFLPEIAKLRARTGRPHWLTLDETHHCLPAKWDPAPIMLPQELPAAIAVTVHPDEVAKDFLEMVSTVVGVGDGAQKTIEQFCGAVGWVCHADQFGELAPDQVYVLRQDGVPQVITAKRPKEKLKRHLRKYAEGELGEDKSFYFRGPKRALNLRAQNLSTFVQLADGVDDETWLHHLRAGEYSQWFRDAIKDPKLAADIRTVEQDEQLSARDSRSRIKDMIVQRYTAPAKTNQL